MCTIGGLGRHIGRQSTDISVDYRSATDRLSVDSRPIVNRCITRYVHIYRSTVGRYISRLSVDNRPIVDRQLTDNRPTVSRCIGRYVHIYWSTAGRYIGPPQSTNYRPIVGRLWTDSRPIVDRQSVNSRPICRPRPPIVHMIQKVYPRPMVFE